ncbi:hypothetical protein [Rubricoccus marinus]|uniref:Uncharacterized protein n=1 Tax=Rubricoccus marinus TaxID=716817 RepID=A0A259TWN8_9BACT|nr:hypothetical protein [Rubricoccus marinus]OZC02106.1 hypothetical protein BSZ36_03370 [Rubricoccus marinus]
MRIPILLVCLLALAACDSTSDSEGVARGQFEATLTGAVDASLRGTAVAQRRSDVGEESLVVITMLEGGFSGRALSLIGDEQSFARSGTVSLGSDEAIALVYTDLRGDTGETLYARGGSVTFTQTSESRIVGTFSAQLSVIDAPTSTAAEVEGSFDAVNLPLP